MMMFPLAEIDRCFCLSTQNNISVRSFFLSGRVLKKSVNFVAKKNTRRPVFTDAFFDDFSLRKFLHCETPHHIIDYNVTPLTTTAIDSHLTHCRVAGPN